MRDCLTALLPLHLTAWLADFPGLLAHDIEVDQKALIVSGPGQGFSRSAGRIGLALLEQNLLQTECVYRFGFAGRDVVDGEEEDAPGSQQWTPWPEIDEMSCCAEHIEEIATPVQRALAGFRGV